MKLIIISDNGSYHRKIIISWRFLAILVLILSVVAITALVGYKLLFDTDTISKNEIQLLNKFDSMLMKTAKLKGQVKRLNSLGKVIATKHYIDVNAYLLSQAPAMVGIDSLSSEIVTQASLAKSINDLELVLKLQEKHYNIMRKIQASPNPPISKLVDSTNQLESSNQLKKSNQLEKNNQIKKSNPSVLSYSTPVLSGYVSSSFGKRRDPINGHQRHHNGIDIAAKHGSIIKTIASGFVTFSGRKRAYGNVIDIHHSDSLKSRYAHLDTIRVKKGEVVRKGDIIATMGQTGRATGSHLHLEVWEKNQPVNPKSYIDTALIK